MISEQGNRLGAAALEAFAPKREPANAPVTDEAIEAGTPVPEDAVDDGSTTSATHSAIRPSRNGRKRPLAG